MNRWPELRTLTPQQMRFWKLLHLRRGDWLSAADVCETLVITEVSLWQLGQTTRRKLDGTRQMIETRRRRRRPFAYRLAFDTP
jgi:hypothetical protein